MQRGGTKSSLAVALGESQGGLPERSIGAQSTGKEGASAWRRGRGCRGCGAGRRHALKVLEAKVNWHGMGQWGAGRLRDNQGSVMKALRASFVLPSLG